MNIWQVDFYLKNNDSAYLIEPDSPEEILNAIKTILGDKDKATKVGVNGHLVAKRYFNRAIHKKQLAEFIKLNF